MKRVFRVVVGLAVSAVGGSAGAASPMKPGLWETTVNTEMSGMPQGKGPIPPMTSQHCFLPKDTEDLRRTVPKNANCKLDRWNQSGNTVSWKMSCSRSGSATMTGRIVYSGDSYVGEGETVMSMGGNTVHMKQHVKARRIGDCKK